MIYNIEHDEQGREVANQERVALPAGWDRPLSLDEQIKRMVRQEMSRQAVEQGFESFEEADDFDVDDEEGEFVSPYEIRDMTPYEAARDPDGPARQGDMAESVKTPPEAAKAVPGASAEPGKAPVPPA